MQAARGRMAVAAAPAAAAAAGDDPAAAAAPAAVAVGNGAVLGQQPGTVAPQRQLQSGGVVRAWDYITQCIFMRTYTV